MDDSLTPALIRACRLYGVQFSLGSQIWSSIPEQITALTNRTVLTFDLYGRGLSDAAFPNDVHLFTGERPWPGGTGGDTSE